MSGAVVGKISKKWYNYNEQGPGGGASTGKGGKLFLEGAGN